MIYLALLGAIAALLVYVLVLRPILREQPMLSPLFRAEASWWDQLQAKLTGFRTKLAARLLGISGLMVALYDQVLPLIAGQDWTPLTSKLPGWALPVGMVALSWLFDRLRAITANPPRVITQKIDGAPQVVAIDKPAG